MKYLLLLFVTLSLLAFQNCSETQFSDAVAANSKVGANDLEVGPPLSEVAPEDEEWAQEYYSCEDADSDSSDDMDSESSDDNDKVAICHNGHMICISENALPAHMIVHQHMHEDNYGDCAEDEDSESDDDQ